MVAVVALVVVVVVGGNNSNHNTATSADAIVARDIDLLRRASSGRSRRRRSRTQSSARRPSVRSCNRRATVIITFGFVCLARLGCLAAPPPTQVSRACVARSRAADHTCRSAYPVRRRTESGLAQLRGARRSTNAAPHSPQLHHTHTQAELVAPPTPVLTTLIRRATHGSGRCEWRGVASRRAKRCE